MKKQLVKKLSTSGKIPCLNFTKDLNMCDITSNTIVSIELKKKGTRLIIDILPSQSQVQKVHKI